MNDIPLVQRTDVNSINTSIIAIKKQLKQIEQMLGGIGETELPTDILYRKDIADAVQEGNNNPVSSGAVDEAIKSLDVPSVGGSGKYISAIEEVDGKINATANNIDTTPTSESSNPVSSGAVAGALAQKRALVTSSFYSSSTYDRNLALMAHAFFEGGGGFRDIALTGSLYYTYQHAEPRYLYAFDFLLSVRITSRDSISPATFRVTAKDGNSQNVGDCFTATYKIGSDRRIDIYLYAKINGMFDRYSCIIDNLFYGDVYPLQTLPNKRLDMTTSYVASIPSDQTVITINSN